MKIMGLDLSIHSTGVCIYDTETKESIYYIIGDKFTQKAMNHISSRIKLIKYDKTNIDKKTQYHIQERDKTNNIYNIVSIIRGLIKQYNPECCGIEGVAFCANGDVVGLAGLNYASRMMLIEMGVNVFIVSPTQNKKYATGNGAADKDLMMYAWRNLVDDVYEENSGIKYDDVADAYFLARYVECGILQPSKQND